MESHEDKMVAVIGLLTASVLGVCLLLAAAWFTNRTNPSWLLPYLPHYAIGVCYK